LGSRSNRAPNHTTEPQRPSDAIFAGLAVIGVAVWRRNATGKRTWVFFGLTLVGDRPPPHQAGLFHNSN
jgi:hypothetical protein